MIYGTPVLLPVPPELVGWVLNGNLGPSSVVAVLEKVAGEIVGHSRSRSASYGWRLPRRCYEARKVVGCNVGKVGRRLCL